MNPSDRVLQFEQNFPKSLTRLTLLTVAYFVLDLMASDWSSVFAWILILFGMIAIGIPHGALDVVTYSSRFNRARPVYYIIGYLTCIALVIGCWLAIPNITLMGFLLLSAWHFGQADFELWQIERGALIWGATVLSFILGWHLPETTPILNAMGISEEWTSGWTEYENRIQLITAIGLFFSGLISIWKGKRSWSGAVLLIASTAWMPLLIGFALYFVGLHSAAGWTHLQANLNRSAKDLWRVALPYSVGAWLIFALGIWYWNDQDPANTEATVGAFFALLSSLSIPHIIETHFFLRHRLHPS